MANRAFGSKPPPVAFAAMQAEPRTLGLQRLLSQLAIDVLGHRRNSDLRTNGP